MKQVLWTPMLRHHLQRVSDIADQVHVNYPERYEVLEERWALFPQGCFVALWKDGQGSAEDPTSDQIVGYAISHPGLVGKPPALDSLLESLPTKADCLYLHDVALLSLTRGHGLGASLTRLLMALAEASALPVVTLTAVNGSVPFWQAQGFVIIDPDLALARKLASYDSDAAYMIRRVFPWPDRPSGVGVSA